MEPLGLIVVPGLVGGFAIAMLFLRMRPAFRRDVSVDVFEREGRSRDVIHAARIRVAGVGGLGLVAMALAVGVYLPRIGLTLALGVALGVMFAVQEENSDPLPTPIECRSAA